MTMLRAAHELIGPTYTHAIEDKRADCGAAFRVNREYVTGLGNPADAGLVLKHRDWTIRPKAS
jgi:hypothetical protein